MKMTEVRSTQPLSDDDFAAIRANVMSTIAARSHRRALPIVMRLALAAALVIAAGIAVIVRTTPRATVTPGVLPPSVVTSQPAAPAPIVAATVTAPREPVARAAFRPRHSRVRHSEGATTVAGHQNIRMEFRTSDPDVRIIWIASQTPPTTGGKS